MTQAQEIALSNTCEECIFILSLLVFFSFSFSFTSKILRSQGRLRKIFKFIVSFDVNGNRDFARF